MELDLKTYLSGLLVNALYNTRTSIYYIFYSILYFIIAMIEIDVYFSLA